MKAKSTTKRAKKAPVKMQDMKPKKDAKGGAATQGRGVFVLSTDKLGPA